MRRALALAALLVGCQDVKECGGGCGLDMPGLGVVHLCTFPDDTELELCWRDGDSGELAASLAANGLPDASCRDTPRHLGPCRYGCPAGSVSGSNAYNGPWCPE